MRVFGSTGVTDNTAGSVWSLSLIRGSGFGIFAIGCMQAAMLLVSCSSHSPSIDEVAHLPSGISHWQLGRFELYAVNPPLIRSIAALPMMLYEPKYDWSRYSESVADRSEFPVGHEFVRENGIQPYICGRLILMPFASCILVLCGVWGSRLAKSRGVSLAIVAVAALSPSILAHGSMLTPDIGFTCIALFAWLWISIWLTNSGWGNAFSAGVLLGLAMLAKFTSLIFFGMLSIGVMVKLFCVYKRLVRESASRVILQFGLMSSVMLYVVNAGYGFDGTGSRLGGLPFVSSALTDDNGTNVFSETWLASIPVPLPKCYLLGIDTQKRDFEIGYRSYLMGEWKHGGWPHYYVVGFLVKEPIGFQLMLYASILHGLYSWKTWTRYSILRWSFIVIPPVMIFGLVSSQTGFNHHMRYVLPAYPFLFVIAGRVVKISRIWVWFSCSCLVWQAISVLCVAPHWLSYFNEIAGGPNEGHQWLVDSNIDWGQDILELKDWQENHPEVDLQAALFAGFDPTDIGLRFRAPPPYVNGDRSVVSGDGLRGPQPGWYAISVCQLKGHSFNVPVGNGDWVWSDGHFTYFADHFTPVELIGYSIYIYHISTEDAATIRLKLLDEENRVEL